MAIDQAVLVNRLDKKVNYGLARTDYSSIKSVIAESITSPFPNPAHTLWMDSDLIPENRPSVNSNTVVIHQYNTNATYGYGNAQIGGVLELTPDPTVISKRCWLACTTPGNPDSTRLVDWLRVTFGSQYFPKFCVGPRSYTTNSDGSINPGAGSGLGSGNHDLQVSGSSSATYRNISPVKNGEEYYFDTEAGVLVFAGDDLPDNVDDNGYSVYLYLAGRYVGPKGFKNANWNDIVTIDYSQLNVPSTPYLSFIGEVNDPSFNNGGTNVSSLLFDVDSGFALDHYAANNTVKVRMESTFKTWKIYEGVTSPTSSNIIAQAVDTISLYGGTGVSLTANTETGSKALTINQDPNYLTPFANTSRYAQTLSSNEYEILVDASGDNIVMEQSQFLTEDGDTLTDQDGTPNALVFEDSEMKIQMDDQTGAYYLDYENFINKPSLVSYFVNDSGYATEAEVHNHTTLAINTQVNKEFVNALSIDYHSLSATPQNLSDFNNDLTLASFANDTNFADTNYVNTTIETNVSNTFVEGLQVDYRTLSHVPTSLSEFANDVSFATTSYVTDTVSNTYVEGLQVDYRTLSHIPTALSEFANDVNFVDQNYVDTKVAAVVDSAPATLDTLNELAAALNDDADFATTVTTQLGLKANTAMLSEVGKYGRWSDLTGTVPGLSTFANDVNFIDQNYVDTNLILKANTSMLSEVGKYGRWSDLTGTPSDISIFNNDANYATTSDITSTISNTYVEGLQVDYRTLAHIPTNLSDFANDVNFVDQNYVDTSLVLKANTAMLSEVGKYGRWDDLIGTPPPLSTFANDVNFATTSYVTDTITKSYIEGKAISYTSLDNLPTIPSTLVSLTNVTQNLLANGDVLTYESDNTRWINKPLDYNYLQNKPSNLSDFNNDSGYVTSSGLLNTISLGNLSNVGSGADSSSNGYFLSYLTDYSEWRPIAVSQVASGVLESLSGTDVLNLVKTADGTGSGLDSDFLDGHQSTYFTDGTNITFTGADIDVGTGDISTESGTLAVGNTSPAVPVQLGSLGFDEKFLFIQSAGTQITFDEWDATKFRAAKYLITIEDQNQDDVAQTADPGYLAFEALVLHDGTSAYMTTYGEVDSGVDDSWSNITWETNLNSSNKVRLMVVSTSAQTRIKASRQMLTL